MTNSHQAYILSGRPDHRSNSACYCCDPQDAQSKQYIGLHNVHVFAVMRKHVVAVTLVAMCTRIVIASDVVLSIIIIITQLIIGSWMYTTP